MATGNTTVEYNTDDTATRGPEWISSEEVEAIRARARARGLRAEEANTPSKDSIDVQPASLRAEPSVEEKAALADVDKLVEGIDFSDGNVQARFVDSYHSQGGAVTTRGGRNTLDIGQHQFSRSIDSSDVRFLSQMGEAVTQEAHYSHEPQERVAILSPGTRRYVTKTVEVPRRGLGRLFGSRKTEQSELEQIPESEQRYLYCYSFAAPTHGEPSALATGNNSGQYIDLEVALTKDQAKQLTAILQDDPDAARRVLDGFARSRLNFQLWNKELFDDRGEFHDAALDSSGREIGRGADAPRSRDVRPHYSSSPDLHPTIVKLPGDFIVAKV